MTPALVDNIPADVIDGMKQANALPYLGEPEDIAHAMVYLASGRISLHDGADPGGRRRTHQQESARDRPFVDVELNQLRQPLGPAPRTSMDP